MTLDTNATSTDGMPASVGPDDDAARRAELRHNALCDVAIRQELYMSHPVVCDTLQVATGPVRKVYDTIVQAIVHRTSGTSFVGDFRMGKTSTIGVVRSQLAKKFPKLPVTMLVAKHHDKPSERAFFGDVLNDFRHSAALSGSAAERRLRLLTLIANAALSLGSDRYVIFIDEGQNWGIQEFVWMRDLTNDLKERGIKCIVVVFGHSELERLRDLVVSTGRTDLLGRFFLTSRSFQGMDNAEDLRLTLKAFDNPAAHEFPLGSGVSMSEFFLPSAFEGGWRLSNEAEALWTAFERVASKRGRSAGNIGMQWVMSSIRSMLFSAASVDAAGFHGDVDSWVEAVLASEYESSLQ